MSMSFLYWSFLYWNRRQYSSDLTGAKGKDHLSQPAGTAFPDTESVDLHCYMGTLLIYVQLLAHQDPPHPLMPSSFSLVGPKTFTSAQQLFLSGWRMGIFFCWTLFLQPVEVPLNSSTTTPYFIPSANLLRVPSVPLFWSLRKMAPISTGVHN